MAAPFPAIITTGGSLPTDVVMIDYGIAADTYTHLAVNSKTGYYVARLLPAEDDEGNEILLIETNSLGTKPAQFPWQAIYSVNGVSVSGANEEERTHDAFLKLTDLL